MGGDQALGPGIEQRRAPRYALPPFGGAVSVVGAQLVNASAYGVLIETLVPMETESVMPLRLVVAGDKLDVAARVVQCVAAAGEKRRAYRIGLEFVSLQASLREQLAEVLRSAAVASPGVAQPKSSA
jgi:hypothetical protein